MTSLRTVEPDPPHAVDIKAFLGSQHAQNAVKPIEWPNEVGAFPGSRLQQVPPLVVDANQLLRDVAYTARTGKRTALISLANTGYIRLFCAQHVLDEVREHATEMAARLNAPLRAFTRCWVLQYLPLLRCVEVPEGLLAGEETRRIEKLTGIDPDDIPSATLAIVLGAYYFTEDRAAREAVYGPDVDHEFHDGALKIIHARGNEVVLEDAVRLLTLAPVGMGYGIYKAVEWAWNRSPWIALLELAGVAIAWKSLSPEWRQRLKTGTTIAWEIASPFFVEYAAVYGVLDSVMAYTPQWNVVAEELPPLTVLGRACAHTLARSGPSERSAAELTQALPYLGTPRGEAKVRATLRSLSCFEEVYRGRWQVGASVAPPKIIEAISKPRTG